MPDLSTSPVLVYVALVAGAIVIIAQAAPKVLGPVGEALSAWAEAKRSRTAAAETSELAIRDRRIAYLQGLADARQIEIETRDRLILDHIRWDHNAMATHPELGHPPRLLPIPQSPPD